MRPAQSPGRQRLPQPARRSAALVVAAGWCSPESDPYRTASIGYLAPQRLAQSDLRPGLVIFIVQSRRRDYRQRLDVQPRLDAQVEREACHCLVIRRLDDRHVVEATEHGV